MIHFFVLLLSLTFSAKSHSEDAGKVITTAKACIVKKEEIVVDPEIQPSYLRVHPEGKYILYTDDTNESSSLLEIKKMNNTYVVKNYLTPMQIEAFPVEPDWQLISSPYHNDGTMKYFLLQDLLTKKPEDVKAVHSSNFNEYYHSIGGDGAKFSLLRWNFLGTKDFEVMKKDGVLSLKESISPYILCSNLFNLPVKSKNFLNFLNEGLLRIHSIMMTDSFEDNYERADKDVLARYEAKGLKIDHDDPKMQEQYEFDISRLAYEYDLVSLQAYVESGQISQQDVDDYKHFNALFFGQEQNKKGKGLKKIEALFEQMDFYVLTKPILSKDAKYVSGMLDGSTRVYKINENKTCTEISNLGADVSKAGFAYPETFKNPVISFYVEDEEDYDKLELYVHDVGSKTTILVDTVRANTQMGYPGFTKDGRLVYMNDNKIIMTTLKMTPDKQLDSSCIQVR